jgi:hypothetical protein
MSIEIRLPMVIDYLAPQLFLTAGSLQNLRSQTGGRNEHRFNSKKTTLQNEASAGTLHKRYGPTARQGWSGKKDNRNAQSRNAFIRIHSRRSHAFLCSTRFTSFSMGSTSDRQL